MGTEIVRPIASLRPHPESEIIFHQPEDSEQWADIFASIKKHGVRDPIVIKEDGTIISGHLRVHALEKLGKKEVACRVIAFDSYWDEVEYLVSSNLDRRDFGIEERAWAGRRLGQIPREQGGAKGKHGGDTRSKKPGKEADQGGSGATLKGKTRDVVAQMLGTTTKVQEAAEVVFCPAKGKETCDVPASVQAAVKSGKVAPVVAAKAIKVERERQGGEIKDPTPIASWVSQKTTKPTATPQQPTHEERVEAQAREFTAHIGKLFDLYKQLDQLLARRPLKSVIGPTEHHEYASLIRDISLRAWGEIEEVQGPTNAGKQMRLAVIEGGSK
ncbi:MAG: ParB N-terminal domain-containing protein [Brevundimonas sp.]